ncbi:MAG TPA: hypothetical protein VLK29_00860 [Luteimonas sp.]|nr:hypothetical protein [Luteimonas sp.]
MPPNEMTLRDAARTEGARHTASIRLRAGSASVEADAAISTRGLLAVGGMVSSILLSVAVLVLVSTRKLPDGTLPRGLRRG